MQGQGYDCNFGVTGSFNGVGTIGLKSQKYSNKAKKKMLVDGSGTTVGYKYYDFYEEATIDGWVAAASGNTGTVTPTTSSIGANIVVTSAGFPTLNGTWSLDSYDLNGQVEDTLGYTFQISRYKGTTMT